MLGHRELTMADYADIFRRRRWVILGCAVALCAAGIGASYLIPPRYVSQTLVLIEQQQVPEDYVKPVVTGDLGEHHMASMRERILSRSRIQPIIERFHLYAGKEYDMDDRVALTQAAIGIRPIPSARGGMPGFYITFRAPDPHTAQLVCGEISSLFVSDNLRERAQTAEGTTDFLKQQLADSKRNLDEQDAKLAAFQQAHFGMLPDQQTSNADTLQALTTQMNAATEALSRSQQNETLLQAMISQQSHDAQAAGTAPDDARKQLQELVEQKQTLQALYTPDHPDVVALSRKIADLQAAIAHAPDSAAKTGDGTPESPQLVQLKAQLQAAQQSMADEKLQQAHIEEQIRTYEARIESTPRVDQEFKQITRDHESALQFYNSLLAKMNESSMAAALEQRQQGEQFRVLDAPNLPEDPTFPNHLVFAGGGFIGGLVMGLLLAGLLEHLDTSVRNELDVWAFTKLPTLATISRIQDLAKLQKTKRRPPPVPASSGFLERASS